MNEGQRRYAMEQYNLALVRRGLPIDHPIPEGGQAQIDPSQESGHSEYETANEDSDSDTIVGDNNFDSNDGYETAVEQVDSEGDVDMAPPGNRPGPSQPSTSAGGGGGRALKRTRTEDSGVDDAFSLPGTAQGQGGSTGEPLEIISQPLPRPTLKINSYIRYYRKVHRFLSWGIAYQVMSKNINDVEYRNISTPFVQIPWDRPYLYLTLSEYTQLARGATVTKTRCEVRARNVRVAFPTNSSGTELATLNQNKDVCYAIGLNKSCNVINVQYLSFQDGQPMIPTDYEIDNKNKHQDLNDDLYGRIWDDDVLTVPRHQMGIPTPLPTYAMIPYWKMQPEAGYPCFQHFYKNFYGDELTGKAICKVEYTPKMGIIKQPIPIVNYTYPQIKDQVNVPVQGVAHDFHTTALKIQPETGKPTNLRSLETQTNSAIEWDLNRFDLIEKSQYMRHGHNGMLPVEAQPSLHVAVQPTPALDTKALSGKSNSNFTDCQAYWEVICEMEVNNQYPTPYPLYNSVHGGVEDMIFRQGATSATPLNEFAAMYNGLYISNK